MIRILALAATLLLAAPAIAQNSIGETVTVGEITATLDGAERTWFLTEAEITSDGATEIMSQSDFSGDASWADVSLFGHTTPDTIMNSTEGLAISFASSGPGEADGVEIRFLTEGMFKGYVAEGENGARVTVDSLAAEGEGLRISGTFAATLGYSDTSGGPVDMTNTRAIEGSFDVVVGPVR